MKITSGWWGKHLYYFWVTLPWGYHIVESQNNSARITNDETEEGGLYLTMTRGSISSIDNIFVVKLCLIGVCCKSSEQPSLLVLDPSLPAAYRLRLRRMDETLRCVYHNCTSLDGLLCFRLSHKEIREGNTLTEFWNPGGNVARKWAPIKFCIVQVISCNLERKGNRFLWCMAQCLKSI